MTLKKIKLGDYICQYSKVCGIPNLSNEDVSGVNRDKEFFEPSQQVGSDTSKYKIVPPKHYACNLMHVGRDKVLPIALNHTDKNKIVSPAYFVFSFMDNEDILTEYFFILLKCNERDRYFWFHTDGSVRDGMSWDELCDVELEVPSIDIQRKYVAIYNSMVANQKAYETGLEDLKLTCDATIERFKASYPIMDTKRIMARRNERNTDLDAEYWGISESGFIPPKQGLSEGNILRKKCFYLDDFIFTPSGVNIHNRFIKQGVCSHVNEMFYSKNDSVLSNYVELWFKRDEFIRLCSFHNITSVMSNFSYDTLSFYNVPIPPKNIQLSISNIFSSYIIRKQINEKLKNQIKDICPILIKGSIEEAKKAVS